MPLKHYPLNIIYYYELHNIINTFCVGIDSLHFVFEFVQRMVIISIVAVHK